jgi:hypothetical protein
VKITISSPKAILVAFIRATLPGEFCIDQATRARSLRTKWANPSLAEKPKVGKLQMDWLRSEDLKEEKNVTASTTMIAALPLWRRQEAGRRGPFFHGINVQTAAQNNGRVVELSFNSVRCQSVFVWRMIENRS